MPKRALHVVPDDRFTPYPVNLARLKTSLSRLGYESKRTGDTLDITVQEKHLTVQMLGDNALVSVETRWNTDLPHSEVDYALFAAADSWNRDSHFPTIYTTEDKSGAAVVVAAFTHVAGAGMTDEQIDHTLDVGIRACVRAANYMVSVSHTILQLPPTPDA